MTKIRLGARQGATLRYIAQHPGLTAGEIAEATRQHGRYFEQVKRIYTLSQMGVIGHPERRLSRAHWSLTDAGREWLATRANPMVVPAKPRRLVIGRRMRAAVAYVAKHEGCTKYAAGKAVTRPGHQRDGWVIVQRCIDAGLISARKRRDGTTALSVTERGWVS